jgi:hydroxyacylglutathione hydrolase
MPPSAMTRPHIESFVIGPYETNCFVVRPHADAMTCWIVDCGFTPKTMLDHVTEAGLTPEAILLTHCHSDHVAGLDEALQRFGRVPMYVHEAEVGFCSDPMLNLSGAFGHPIAVTEPDRTMKDGDVLSLDGVEWTVRHTPGHSPGGVIFVHEPSAQAIVGDTLFAGSIGRTDFPTSDGTALRRSLRDVLMSLPDEMTIYPGHGPATTIGRERVNNPFLQG